jgi:hypothetical protein
MTLRDNVAIGRLRRVPPLKYWFPWWQGRLGRCAVDLAEGGGGLDSGHRLLSTVQHDLKLRRITTLARGDHQRQRFLRLLGGQVQLGGQPTPRPSQCMISWLFFPHPARRLTLISPFSARQRRAGARGRWSSPR